MNRSEIIVTALTAVLAFFGALAGVKLGSALDQKNWEERFTLEQKRTLLEKQVATAERLVIIMNKAPLMRGLQASLEAEREYIKLALACNEQNLKSRKTMQNCIEVSNHPPERLESIGREIYIIGAEYAAAITLTNMYYGPETRDAISDIGGKQWWSEETDVRKILDAMGREINFFPPNNKI